MEEWTCEIATYHEPLYPVEHGQTRPHLKCGCGEVNPLQETGEQLVVEALHPVSVTELQGELTD
jgi:hypothetical protein